jgi:hypothetical protein
VQPGVDPPLSDQLQPLDVEELRRRIGNLQGAKNSNNTDGCSGGESSAGKNLNREETLALAVEKYMAVGPRREVRLKGRPLPVDICQRLLKLLEGLRWPAQNQRRRLSAERYLVLVRSSKNDAFYGELRDTCSELMQWADPKYYYSGIAVTKNFVASPHIDDRDQSFQYAVALGGFTSGGELCVEGCSEGGMGLDDWVNVVETHNRIARVDGRNVHWVRTWDGGDRYSLVFYNTSDREPSPVIKAGVDLNYLSQMN